MEDNYDLIEPIIFHKPGECPVCGHPLTVIDTEMTIMELNPNGTAATEETIVRCMAGCRNCGTKIPMMRWQGGYLPYSRDLYLLKRIEARDLIEDRLNHQREMSKKNPLAL